MEREQVIKALYDANTEGSVELAHEGWLASYKAASETDRKYLLAEYFKYGEHILSENRESNLEMKRVMAEFEAMQLAGNQHQ